MAVERERPLDPGQTGAKTVVLAARAMVRAVANATTVPLLVARAAWDRRELLVHCRAKVVAVSRHHAGLSALAMIRVHALAGYCTPRHAMVVAWILILAGGAGLERVASSLAGAAARFLGDRLTIQRVDVAIKTIALGGFLLAWAPALTAPIDSGFAGYRQAGEWLATHGGCRGACDRPQGFIALLRRRAGLHLRHAHRRRP